MNNITQALKNLTRRGQHNIIKILCLGIGFALASVLIAKLWYEHEYDTCYPDHDRIYRISEKISRGSDPEAIYGNTPGGIATTLKKYIPEIETATRINPACYDEEMKINGEQRVKGNIYVVDSCFFKMFPAKILDGDADDVLAKPYYCLVSRSMAERMGGNVIGRKLELTSIPGLTMTIGAVYEDYPWNSSFHDYDVMLSMTTQRSFSYDGQDNLLGNDSYYSFIKVNKGCSPEQGDFDSKVNGIINKFIPDLKKDGIKFSLNFTPISKYHQEDGYFKRTFLMMMILAAVILAASVLNYLLIVIGNTVTRGREMAVRKCYGAMPRNILGITIAETLVHMVLAMVLAAALIYVCKGSIQTLLAAPVSSLFTSKSTLFLAVLLIVVFVVSTLLPGRTYNNVPVTTVFRNFKENRRRWKMALLAVQFVFVSFLVCLLLIVNSQYSKLTNFDLGYSYDRLAIINVNKIKGDKRSAMITELNNMPEIEDWTAITSPIFSSGSGNNIVDPETGEEMFNATDLYMAGDNYLDMLDIKLKQGRGFNANSDSLKEMMVSPELRPKAEEREGMDRRNRTQNTDNRTQSDE